MQLDSTQRKRLRGLAHALRPAVHVGARGLTEAVTRQIDEALERHELIKVKIAAEREQRQRMAEQTLLPFRCPQSARNRQGRSAF